MDFLHLPIEDPVLTFGLIMSVILIAPMVVNKIKLPGIIGIIVAGVVIGPNALNLLARGELITLLGTAGLLYIMFMAGLEINMNQFLRHKNRSLIFGTLTFMIPQVTGTIIFLWLGFDWLAAVLIASMFASHTLVAYPIIQRLGLSRNEAVTTTVGGTILTDTVALLVLAVVARLSEGDMDASFWITLGISFPVYIAAVFYIIPRLGKWFFSRVESKGSTEFVFLIAVVFLVAWLAKVIGTEPIIGAFMAGLAFNRLIPSRSPIMNRIEFFGNSFLVPFFLLYIGMLVDLEVLFSSVEAWIVMAAMIFTNTVTKYISSMLTRRIFNFTKAEGLVIFGLSTTEAAATLAAALVGVEVGVIGDEVLNGVILLILVTCIIGPWFVQQFGAKVAREKDVTPQPYAQRANRILVPVYNPETADRLVEVASFLHEDPRDVIYPLTVVTDTQNPFSHITKSERLLAQAIEDLNEEDDLHIEPLVRVDLNVATGIQRAILEKSIRLVIMGWEGAKTSKLHIFDSVRDHLLDEVPQKMMVCKIKKPLSMVDRVVTLVPPFAKYDPGYAESIHFVEMVAERIGASLHVIGIDGKMEELKEAFVDNRMGISQEFAAVKSLDNLPKYLSKNLTANDLFIIINSRRGTVGWSSGLNALPRMLSEQFPAVDFISIYPHLIEDNDLEHWRRTYNQIVTPQKLKEQEESS